MAHEPALKASNANQMSMADITHAIKEKMMSGKTDAEPKKDTADADGENTEDIASDDVHLPTVVAKPKVKASAKKGANVQKFKAEVVKKGKPAANSRQARKRSTDPNIKSVDCRPQHADDTLEYKHPASASATAPRYYKLVTIYNDRVRQQWRVKPAPGRRGEVFVSYKGGPKKAWEKVVRLAKTIK